MKKKIIRILVLLFLIAVVFHFSGGFKFGLFQKTAFAVGDLLVDWGVVSGDPIFVVNNFLPGDTEERAVKVENSALSIRPIGIRGIKTEETNDLSGALNIEIKEGAAILYGPKPLSDFFTDSSGPFGIFLSQLSPGQETTYTFRVTLPSDAGNEFQGTAVIFDLKIGISLDVPAECEAITQEWNPIFGTSGNDNITGTKGSDIIVGFEGDDRIVGRDGADCIIAGDGNDRVDGNDGDDVILGGDGNDRLEGNDGNDRIFGEDGDDILRGRNGDDTLIGGDGNDRANGRNGIDTCDAEIEVNCEL